ncbi:MAG: hypothetical protein HYW50_03165, partial [Candidatus Diapherotrites archaeon]|nr:hypothetical protein [Candidatus Diapherotrites archaeon]
MEHEHEKEIHPKEQTGHFAKEAVPGEKHGEREQKAKTWIFVGIVVAIILTAVVFFQNIEEIFS